MKALKTALIAGVAGVAVAGFASAASAQTVAYNVGLASDYIFRGIDQSPVFGDTQVFGGADLTIGSFYAGVWASNTGPAIVEGFEYDIYGGYKLAVGGATVDLGIVTYNYSDGSFTSSDLNNWEAKAAVSIPAGAVTLGAAVYYTPQYGASGEKGTYMEANAAYTLDNKATLSGAYGRQSVEESFFGVDGYSTWNVGLTYPLTDKLSIDARYIGADDDVLAVGGISKSRGVATIKATF